MKIYKYWFIKKEVNKNDYDNKSNTANSSFVHALISVKKSKNHQNEFIFNNLKYQEKIFNTEPTKLNKIPNNIGWFTK